MDIEQYLARIEYKKKLQINKECLKELHLYHVSSIPFENLDIHLNKKIDLSLNDIFEKVITNKRGGYCYELNFLFNCLLSKIGFQTKLVSARIYNENTIGPEYDHLAIITDLDTPWLIDVGYGDLFKKPLPIIPCSEQIEDSKKYKLEHLKEDIYILKESLITHEKWHKRYTFSLKPCKINDFEIQNKIKQLSEESYFVKNTICTLPTENGRKTIFNNVFKIRTANKVEQIEIKSKQELMNILASEFGISISF